MEVSLTKSQEQQILNDEEVTKPTNSSEKLQQAVEFINSDMISEAIEVLVPVLDVYMDKYGETGLECAPLFFRYGQALLFQAQDMPGHKQAAADYDSDDSESEEEEEQDQELDSEEEESDVERGVQGSVQEKSTNYFYTSQKMKTHQSGLHIDDDEHKQDKLPQHTIQSEDVVVTAKPKIQSQLLEKENHDVKNSIANEIKSDEILCDEEGDLQSAWEYLETARHIYEQNGKDNYCAELAEVLCCLGDVSSEREDFETAIADYKRALDLFATLTQNINGERSIQRLKTRRRVAETNFKLALAMQFTFRYSEADQQINSALGTLTTLQDDLIGLDSIDDKTKQKNIEEIQGSIQDLQTYQKELQELAKAGEVARIKSAIEAAQVIANKQNGDEQQAQQQDGNQIQEYVDQKNVLETAHAKQNSQLLEVEEGAQQQDAKQVQECTLYKSYEYHVDENEDCSKELAKEKIGNLKRKFQEITNCNLDQPKKQQIEQSKEEECQGGGQQI